MAKSSGGGAGRSAGGSTKPSAARSVAIAKGFRRAYDRVGAAESAYRTAKVKGKSEKTLTKLKTSVNKANDSFHRASQRTNKLMKTIGNTAVNKIFDQNR